MTDNYSELLHPRGYGYARLQGLVHQHNILDIRRELERVRWRDNRSTRQNSRGSVVQRHDAYVHDLTKGDQTPLERIPVIDHIADMAQESVRSLGHLLGRPVLQNWTATELSIHRYDKGEGISYHRDHARFTGAIAIVGLTGYAELAIKRPNRESVPVPVWPGDLILLRAPGLVDAEEDMRPEHAVINASPGRTSLMLRQNSRPDEPMPQGFVFDNVQADVSL